MFVFVCARCGAELTVPLSQVSLPVHARQVYGNGLQLPVLMESGTFAVDPDPWGRPWRLWDELDPGEAEARGIYAPVHALSDAPAGQIVIAPGDIHGTRLIPGKRGGACCGIDGADGPNMACLGCDLLVATRFDDCSLWQLVRLGPDAVRRVRVGADAAPLSWAELMEKAESAPPFEPITSWGERRGSGRHWSWSPQWTAAAGRALAHLLVASQGQPVEVPDGMTATVFQHALDTMLPAGAPARHAVLAGPGRPVPVEGADILLVPVHPGTGRTWAPAGPAPAAYSVPLPSAVWRWLHSPQPYSSLPASGRIPLDVLRDESLPPRRDERFRADWRTFQHTLVRLPAVRSPWLRTIVEAFRQDRAYGLFRPPLTRPQRQPSSGAT
ncbi:hypothetical protein ACIP9H_15785 [Streptomyces sp. NPDC088732]|uniref:hypothetical protein n=1 Tax=Streptomyces sp. NPDC088732 TaxID=3365879 RepID=UPI00380A4D24